MSNNPPPAVGQVYELSAELHIVEVLLRVSSRSVRTANGYTASHKWVAEHWRYLGTLDELREHRALRAEVERYRELVRTDNSATIAALEAENAKLRAALREIHSMTVPIGYDSGDGNIARIRSETLTPTPHDTPTP